MAKREFSEISGVPSGEIRFGFQAGQYNGPLADPTWREEVTESGLEEVASDLLRGEVPEEFAWMRPVVEGHLEHGQADRGKRFMAVVEELKRAQAESVRDYSYERRVETMARLLCDSCDENFNYLGFFLDIRTQDGEVRSYQWGRLKFNPVDDQWWVETDFPITEIEGTVPYSVGANSS